MQLKLSLLCIRASHKTWRWCQLEIPRDLVCEDGLGRRCLQWCWLLDYTKISQKEKLLVPKWNLLEKHVGKGKTKGGLDNFWCKMCSCKEWGKICDFEAPIIHGTTSILCCFRAHPVCLNFHIVEPLIDFESFKALFDFLKLKINLMKH
jgi:hypothetical protein